MLFHSDVIGIQIKLNRRDSARKIVVIIHNKTIYFIIVNGSKGSGPMLFE